MKLRLTTQVPVYDDGQRFGALFGSFTSGLIIDKFFTFPDQSKDWQNIWITFASYA